LAWINFEHNMSPHSYSPHSAFGSLGFDSKRTPCIMIGTFGSSASTSLCRLVFNLKWNEQWCHSVIEKCEKHRNSKAACPDQTFATCKMTQKLHHKLESKRMSLVHATLCNSGKGLEHCNTYVQGSKVCVALLARKVKYDSEWKLVFCLKTVCLSMYRSWGQKCFNRTMLFFKNLLYYFDLFRNN